MKKTLIKISLITSLIFNFLILSLLGQINLNKSGAEEKIINENKCHQLYRQRNLQSSDSLDNTLHIKFNAYGMTHIDNVDDFGYPHYANNNYKYLDFLSNERIDEMWYSQKYNTCIFTSITENKSYSEIGEPIDDPNLPFDSGFIYKIRNYSFVNQDNDLKIVNYSTKNKEEFIIEKNKYFEN